MERNKLVWPVRLQCGVLEVNVSGYHSEHGLGRRHDLICIDEGRLYLAVVLDLFSRRIVGWSMGETITADLACHALEIAWQQRSPGKGLIFHSDRGSQYDSCCYTELLASHGISASMSREATAGTTPARRPCSAR